MFFHQRLVSLLFVLMLLLLASLPWSESFSYHDRVPLSPFLRPKTFWGSSSSSKGNHLPTVTTVSTRRTSASSSSVTVNDRRTRALRAVVYDFSEESSGNNNNNNLYSWLDEDDTPSSTSQSSSPWRQHLVEELSDVHHMGALARLACAFSPPEQALQLQHLEHVSVLTVDEAHLEIMAVVCEASGCVTIQVPVVFPKPCLHDSDKECILHQFETLDHHAETILKSQQHQLMEPHGDASIFGFSSHDSNQYYHDDNINNYNNNFYSNQGMDAATTTSASYNAANPISYPSWWVPCHSLDLMSDCESVQRLLNDPDFASEMQTLARYGLDFETAIAQTTQSEHEQQDDSSATSSWIVDQVMVVAVGPSGLILRARRPMMESGSSSTSATTSTLETTPAPVPPLIDIPLSFGRVAESIEEIRASVLGMVAAITTPSTPTTTNDEAVHQEVEHHGQDYANIDENHHQDDESSDQHDILSSLEVPVESLLEEQSESSPAPPTLQVQNEDLSSNNHIIQQEERQVSDEYSQWEEMLQEGATSDSTTMEQLLPDWWVVPIEPDLLEECDSIKMLLNRETFSSELRMLAQKELSKQTVTLQEDQQDSIDTKNRMTIDSSYHATVGFVMVTDVSLSGLHLRATATVVDPQQTTTTDPTSRVMNIFAPFQGAAETRSDLRTFLLEITSSSTTTDPSTPDIVAEIQDQNSTDAISSISNSDYDTANKDDAKPKLPTNLLETVTSNATSTITAPTHEAVVREAKDPSSSNTTDPSTPDIVAEIQDQNSTDAISSISNSDYDTANKDDAEPELPTNLLETVTSNSTTTITPPTHEAVVQEAKDLSSSNTTDPSTPDIVAEIQDQNSTDAISSISNSDYDTANKDDAEPELPTNLLETVTSNSTSTITPPTHEAVVQEAKDQPSSIDTDPVIIVSHATTDNIDDDDVYHHELEGLTNLSETVACTHLPPIGTETVDKNNDIDEDSINIVKNDDTDSTHDECEEESSVVENITKATKDEK